MKQSSPFLMIQSSSFNTKQFSSFLTKELSDTQTDQQQTGKVHTPNRDSDSASQFLPFQKIGPALAGDPKRFLLTPSADASMVS